MILGEVALFLAASLAAQPRPEAGAPAPAPGTGVTQLSKAQAEAILSKCGSRRFETSADLEVNGKRRRTRIELCAADSETNAQWLAKLEKAAGQIAAQPGVPQATKTKLLSDLNAEIARVKSAQALGLGVPQAKPSSAAIVPIEGLAPRPEPASPLADFHALPPLAPAPPPAAVAARTTAAVVRGPQLSVRCAPVGDDRTDRCGLIMPDDRLVIRASEGFKGPVNLRFRRTDSSAIAEVPFAAQGLRAGQTARFSIPKPICRGRVRAEFEIEVVTPGAQGGLGERLGPFEARCGT